MGDDFTSSTSTTGVLTPGSEIKGAIDYNNDKDWIKIQLTSGVLYKFDLLGSKSSGGTLADPYLSLYDSSGRYLSQYAYDGGAYGDPNIGYIPVSSGNYYVEVSSFFSGKTGSYTLRVSQTGTYAVAAASSSVNEGSTATFNITTTNVTAGTSVAYTISGVSSSDVTGGSLTGSVNVGSDGKATVSVPIAADQTTEGDETLTVTVQGQAASTTVKDTSLTPVGTYAVAAASSSVNEGSTATFNITTTNVTAGTSVAYTISGVSSSDVTGGSLTGSVNVGSDGKATVSVPIAADQTTEGDETLTVTVQGKSASTVVKDTSPGQNNLPSTPGNDIFAWAPTSGNVKFDGGAGIDKLVINGKRSDFEVTSSKISSKGVSGSSADLVSVERINFTDVSVAFDADGSAGKVAKLLGAVAGKDSLSNSSVIGIGLKVFDDKLFTEEDVAKILLDALLGSNHSSIDVVNLIYKNLVGVTPDPLTAALFAGFIRPGGYTEAGFAVAVADIDLNKQNIGLVGIYTDGLTFIPPPI